MYECPVLESLIALQVFESSSSKLGFSTGDIIQKCHESRSAPEGRTDGNVPIMVGRAPIRRSWNLPFVRNTVASSERPRLGHCSRLPMQREMTASGRSGPSWDVLDRAGRAIRER